MGDLTKFGNYEWLPNWCKGQDVVILASGYSVREQFSTNGNVFSREENNFDFSRLRKPNTRIIVISHMLNFLPDPDILTMLDGPVLQKLGRDFEKRSFKTVVGRNVPLAPRGQVAKVKYSAGFSLDPNNGLYGKFATGQWALSLALVGRANRIFLLGVDSQVGPKGEPNCYDTKKTKGYDLGTADPERYKRMMNGFNTFVGKGEIYNLSHRSLLTVFPRENLEKWF